MRKKLLSILLVLSLMLALVPAAFAADAVRTELESDGTTLAFYGSGVATADCWNGDWTAVTHVDLGYEIRGVAENVLARCVNLVSFEAIGSRYLRTYNGGLISIDGRQMLAAPNRMERQSNSCSEGLSQTVPQLLRMPRSVGSCEARIRNAANWWRIFPTTCARHWPRCTVIWKPFH